jgi:hypothetical protein
MFCFQLARIGIGSSHVIVVELQGQLALPCNSPVWWPTYGRGRLLDVAVTSFIAGDNVLTLGQNVVSKLTRNGG